MQKKILTPTNITMAIIYMFFILSISVIITLNFRPLYYHDIDRLGIEEASGLTKPVIKENYDALIRYNSMFSYDRLEFPSLAMSKTGEIHFEEVKVIFVAVQYLSIAAFLLGLLGTSWKCYLKDYGYLKIAAVITILMPLILAFLIALNWENFFVTFHHLFFKNDYWIFDAVSDPVISILPDAFFMHCAIMILGLIVLGSGICFGAYRRFLSIGNFE